MNAADLNLPLLESMVAALGPLCDRFVFVGGCVTGLLVTEPASPLVRATRDVDVIASILIIRAVRRCVTGASTIAVPTVSFADDQRPHAPDHRLAIDPGRFEAIPCIENPGRVRSCR